MVHDRHEVVRRVTELWARQSHLCEVGNALVGSSLVDTAPIDHEDQTVK